MFYILLKIGILFKVGILLETGALAELFNKSRDIQVLSGRHTGACHAFQLFLDSVHLLLEKKNGLYDLLFLTAVHAPGASRSVSYHDGSLLLRDVSFEPVGAYLYPLLSRSHGLGFQGRYGFRHIFELSYIAGPPV